MISVVTVLQALEGCSDREAVERLDEDRALPKSRLTSPDTVSGTHRGGVRLWRVSGVGFTDVWATGSGPLPSAGPLARGHSGWLWCRDGARA